MKARFITIFLSLIALVVALAPIAEAGMGRP